MHSGPAAPCILFMGQLQPHFQPFTDMFCSDCAGRPWLIETERSKLLPSCKHTTIELPANRASFSRTDPFQPSCTLVCWIVERHQSFKLLKESDHWFDWVHSLNQNSLSNGDRKSFKAIFKRKYESHRWLTFQKVQCPMLLPLSIGQIQPWVGSWRLLLPRETESKQYWWNSRHPEKTGVRFHRRKGPPQSSKHNLLYNT